MQQGMPQNCSADMSRIADHVDTVINSKNTTAIAELQGMFALKDLAHGDDFAACVPMCRGTPSQLANSISVQTRCLRSKWITQRHLTAIEHMANHILYRWL